MGAPGEDTDGYRDAGLVQIVFGSAKGLSEDAVSIVSPQQGGGAKGFGGDLVTGDFNGDGLSDIAIDGGEAVIQAVYGTASLRHGVPGPARIRGTSEPNGEIVKLAAGDVNGDGTTDLVSSGFWDDPADQGDVLIFHGSADGLGAEPAGAPLGLGGAESALDAGDVNGDGFADIVLPAPYILPGRIYPGGPDGVTETPVEIPDEVAGLGTPAVGDVDGDGHADLVVGRCSGIGGRNAGRAVVHHGGDDWLSPSRAQEFSQATPGVPGKDEDEDCFGGDLSLVDLTADGRLDLVAAATGEDGDNGAVTVLYGTPDGLTADGSTRIDAATLGQNGTKAGFGTGLSGRVR